MPGIFGRGYSFQGLPRAKSTPIIITFLIAVVLAWFFFQRGEVTYGLAVLGIGLSVIAII